MNNEQLLKYIENNYNFNFAVKPFLLKNRFLIQNMFHVDIKDEDNEKIVKIIQMIKITKENMIKFNKNMLDIGFTIETVNNDQLCVNAECIKNISLLKVHGEDNISSTINNNFYEINYNNEEKNIRKGSMSFTTCHEVSGGNEKYLGCPYNISLSSVFLGNSDLFIGRLLLFRTMTKLRIYKSDVRNDKHRYKSEIEYTKLIFDTTKRTANTKKLGFKGCRECLPQKFIYFFLDLYNEEIFLFLKKYYEDNRIGESFFDFYGSDTVEDLYPSHDGIFINDTPTASDDVLGFKISGVELRIYNAHKVCKLSNILYLGKIYNIDKWHDELKIILPKIKKNIVDIVNYYNHIIYIALEYDIIDGESEEPQMFEDLIGKEVKNNVIEFIKKLKSDQGGINEMNYIRVTDKTHTNNVVALLNFTSKKKFTTESFIGTCELINQLCKNKEMLQGGSKKYLNKFIKYREKINILLNNL